MVEALVLAFVVVVVVLSTSRPLQGSSVSLSMLRRVYEELSSSASENTGKPKSAADTQVDTQDRGVSCGWVAGHTNTWL